MNTCLFQIIVNTANVAMLARAVMTYAVCLGAIAGGIVSPRAARRALRKHD